MSVYLLDTHLLIWSAAFSSRLSQEAREILEDQQNVLVFSAVNCWEVTIKRALCRTDFQVDPRILRQSLLADGFRELPITSEHAFTVGNLPTLHRDPFDRLLIAQAMAEQMVLLTSDEVLVRYPGPIQLV